MLNQKLSGIYIICDKCHSVIRVNYSYMMTKKAILYYEKKKSYCGRCIQNRIHRNDKDWNYDQEFKYEHIPVEYDEGYEKSLKLLLSCMM